MALTFKQALAQFWQQIALQFVRKENGKGLSANDFTDEDKAKLAAIDTTATINDATISIAAGAGLTGSGDFTTNQANAETITLGHSNSVTAGTAQGSATKTLTFGDTFTIPTVTYDAQGHITTKGTTTMTMPANPNVDTGATAVEVTGSGNAVTNATYDEASRKITLTKGATYNNYSHPAGNASSKTSGFYKFSTDANSHINGIAEVSKSDITALGLAASDIGAVPTTRKVNNKALSSDITLAASDVDAVPTTRKINNKALSADITLSAADVSAIPASAKGAANGVASLDDSGKVPTSQLPSYVDDVLEYTSKALFPITGETGKIYIDLTTNLAYRWGGSAYAEISPSLALGETSSTAFAGDKGAAAYTHAVTNKGIAAASGLYKITTNSEGHVSAVAAVQKADITGLGIPAQDTVYTHPTGSAASKASGLYKISTDANSHISGVTAVTKSDITALGIPAQDTTYTAISDEEINDICGQTIALVTSVSW